VEIRTTSHDDETVSHGAANLAAIQWRYILSTPPIDKLNPYSYFLSVEGGWWGVVIFLKNSLHGQAKIML